MLKAASPLFARTRSRFQCSSVRVQNDPRVSRRSRSRCRRHREARTGARRTCSTARGARLPAPENRMDFKPRAREVPGRAPGRPRRAARRRSLPGLDGGGARERRQGSRDAELQGRCSSRPRSWGLAGSPPLRGRHRIRRRGTVDFAIAVDGKIQSMQRRSSTRAFPPDTSILDDLTPTPDATPVVDFSAVPDLARAPDFYRRCRRHAHRLHAAADLTRDKCAAVDVHARSMPYGRHVRSMTGNCSYANKGDGRRASPAISAPAEPSSSPPNTHHQDRRLRHGAGRRG